MKKAKSAVNSVFHKDGLEPIVRRLHKDGVKLYSTGGTQEFIESLKIPVTPVPVAPSPTMEAYSAPQAPPAAPQMNGRKNRKLTPKIAGSVIPMKQHIADRTAMDLVY